MNFVSKGLRKVSGMLRFLFGSISYRPPGLYVLMCKGIVSAIKGTRRKSERMKRDHPKLHYTLLIMFLVVCLGAVWLKIWLDSRPETDKLRVSVGAPAPTPLREDAKPYPLYINFTGSAARLEDVEKTVARGIAMDPAVPGQWKWSRDDRLAFIPEQDWPAGTKFRIGSMLTMGESMTST